MPFLSQMPCQRVDARDFFLEFFKNDGISRAFLIPGDVLTKGGGQRISRTGNQLTRRAKCTMTRADGVVFLLVAHAG
jgi:hypothetical protein